MKSQITNHKSQKIGAWNLDSWNLFVSWNLGFGAWREAGFTLIELVVVIGILAVLAVFAIAALNPGEQFAKARDSQRKSDLTQIQRALEQYYQDNGHYPANNSSYQILDHNNNPVLWGGQNGWPPYMNLVPTDPTNSIKQYVYEAIIPSGQGYTVCTSNPQACNAQIYRLYASLDRGPADPQTCNATVVNCINNPTSVSYCTCSGAPNDLDCGANGKHYPCNYGVSSPNTTP